MPIFDYRCEHGHVTEKLVRHFTTTEIVCPACLLEDGTPVRKAKKLIGATKTNFKFADRSAHKPARK
jgi:predicted nucleic acid-binding Zn ribbon protein